MEPIYINLVFEDDLSLFVMRKILVSFGDKFQENTSYLCDGYGQIKSRIDGFNNASIHCPYFILTDLDTYDCPLELIDQWFKYPKKSSLIFRVAVREIEAWILADVEGFSKFTGVSRANFSQNPESLTDAKKRLIDFVRKSRKREIREDIVPIDETASKGPNYNGCLGEFVLKVWSIERAAQNSPSLKKTLDALERFEIKR